jgi:hypothetical protein
LTGLADTYNIKYGVSEMGTVIRLAFVQQEKERAGEAVDKDENAAIVLKAALRFDLLTVAKRLGLKVNPPKKDKEMHL